MIGLMKRILTVSGIYQKRILLAFVFSFLKSLLSKAPIMLAFLVLTGFYEGSISPPQLPALRPCHGFVRGLSGCFPEYRRPASVRRRVYGIFPICGWNWAPI